MAAAAAAAADGGGIGGAVGKPLQVQAVEVPALARAELGGTRAAWRVHELRTVGGAVWPDADERGRLLEDLQPSKDEDTRIQALVRLRSLAVGDFRRRLWQDEELKDALLVCAKDTPQTTLLASQEEPQTMRVLALGVILNALAVQDNRRSLLKDKEARGLLLKAMRKTQGEDVNSRAALVFVGVLIAAVRSESAKEVEDMQRAFSAMVTNKDALMENREALFGALWSAVSSSSADALRLWKSPLLSEAVMQAAGEEEESPEVKASALGALWAFVGEDDKLRIRVWQEEAARAALVAGAQEVQRIDVRRNAMNALASLACTPELREEMWWEGAQRRPSADGGEAGDEAREGAQGDAAAGGAGEAGGAEEAGEKEDEGQPGAAGEEDQEGGVGPAEDESADGPLARLLLESAVEGKPADIRMAALRALTELSWEEGIREPMAWAGPPGAHFLLYRAVDDMTVDIRARRYFKMAYGRVAPRAPEALVMAMIRDRLAKYLLPAKDEGPELPDGWDTYADIKGRTYYANVATGDSSWDVPEIIPIELSPDGTPSDDEEGGEGGGGGEGGAAGGEAVEEVRAVEGPSAAAAASAGLAGSGQERGANPEGALPPQPMPVFEPEPEVPEFIDLANVARCVGARVKQNGAPDNRVGKIIGVEHGTLQVTVQWWDTTYDPLEVGELAYIEDKPGDPAECPIPEELEGMRVRSQHGRIGIIRKAIRRRRGDPLLAILRWDPHPFPAAVLGPAGQLEYVRSPDLRLVSRTIREYVISEPPPPPPTPPEPEPEEEPLPPPERMRSVNDFEELSDYLKYVEDMFKKHGGAVGTRVLYMEDVPYAGIHKGMLGTIKQYVSRDQLQVKWDEYEKKWVNFRRLQIYETADHAFLYTEDLPEPIFCGGGGRSGPESDRLATFEGAEVPRKCKCFVLMTKIRTKYIGRKQHFVAWGSEPAPGSSEVSRRSVDFRLSETGNLEYGEHTGAMAGGWRMAICTPRLNLCDNKWHSVTVVRQDTGFIWMYCDGELVGQACLTANLPPGLTSSAKSYRWCKEDSVFAGDVGPLRIFDQELSIQQVRAHEKLAGTPRFFD